MVNENITSLLEQEAEAVRNIPVTPGYEEAVSLIVKHVHDPRWKTDHEWNG